MSCGKERGKDICPLGKHFPQTQEQSLRSPFHEMSKTFECRESGGQTLEVLVTVCKRASLF